MHPGCQTTDPSYSARTLPRHSETRNLPIAKSPTHAGAGAVIGAGKAWRGTIIPVAVEGDVPGELPPKPDVIGGVEIEVNAARIRERGQKQRANCEIGSIEIVEVHVRGDQPRGDLFRWRRPHSLLVVNSLPAEPSRHRDRRTTGVFQITSNTTAKGRLKGDALLRTLQEFCEAGIVPIVPTQQTESRQLDVITSRNRTALA